ncbi:MAG: 5-bromo-4-chloroindolyl phosphate hydrolysis family protein [Pseudomonadota bacterium]
MSARRFGGAHSPDPATRAASSLPRRRSPSVRREALRLDVRARLMYVLPLPLLFATFWDILSGDLAGTARAVLALALLMGGAFMLNEGQKAHRAYAARAVARRPAIPRKIIAAVLTGLGVGVAQIAGATPDPFVAAGFGAVALVAHLAAFGIDPLTNKGIDLTDAVIDRVAHALDEGERLLREIHDDARKIGDGQITEQLASLGDEVRAMLRRVEADPRDLDRARRYLSVHLVGAHEATRKYAETLASDETAAEDPRLRADYVSLITELEQSFQRGRASMLGEDRTDLEIEIEVLRDRMGRERAVR